MKESGRIDESDLVYEDINFEGIDDDLAAFQEDEMVQQALHRGVDLKKYGEELERDLKEAESVSVEQYVRNNDQAVRLHEEMLDCDRVLAKMEEMLHGFQADLGEISSEIKHLQEDSLSMSVKLKNRRSAEEKLHSFVERVNLPPQTIQEILSPQVNEDFLVAVQLLGKRLRYFELDGPPADDSSLQLLPADTRCGIFLYPELEKLRTKAIAKCREYFSTQFSNLRKPKTNVHMLQQTALLKYAQLFQFVQKECPPVAEELRAMYVESMGRTLSNVFKTYYAQLAKQELVVATKTDLVAVEEQALKSIFTHKVDMTKRSDAFSLGDRERVLEQIEREPLLVHVVIAENSKLPFESIFRSVLKHLIDAASNEFLFIIDFFKTSPKDTFNRIYGKTLSMLLENIENYLLSCYDAVGMLLMIRMTYLLRLVMQRRRIPVLDPFFDRLSLLFWPRFKQIIDANVKSIKTANQKKLGPVDLSPHYISRRFAELVASISSLQGCSAAMLSGARDTDMEGVGTASAALSADALGIGGGGDHMVQQDIQTMRMEMIGLLERLAGNFSNIKEQRVFFINNYDMILSIFQERHLMSDEVNKFESLLMTQKELFAEEEVKYFFPRLVAFVLQTEQQMVVSNAKVTLEDSFVEGLVRDFANNWRTGVQQINDDVLLYFANFRNGMEILKQVLTQLLLYYTRFQDLIKKNYSRPPPFSRDIVSTATILMEIKRYSRTF